MSALRFYLLGFAALMLLVPGCGNKQEPFKEWWASEKYADYVPPDAQIVAEGKGTPLKYTPQTRGTLYLLDLDDMRTVKEAKVPHVVVTGGPEPGTEITFDPKTATVSRAGKSPQKLTTIHPDHKFQLRWMPEDPNYRR